MVEVSMRILLADGREKVRSALQLLLEQEPGVEVVGEAGNSADLLLLAEQEEPDVILLDWELPGSPMDALLPALSHTVPTLKVIALSVRPEARRAAGEVGVAAFVSKNAPSEELLAALDIVRSSPHSSNQELEGHNSELSSHVS